MRLHLHRALLEAVILDASEDVILHHEFVRSMEWLDRAEDKADALEQVRGRNIINIASA